MKNKGAGVGGGGGREERKKENNDYKTITRTWNKRTASWISCTNYIPNISVQPVEQSALINKYQMHFCTKEHIPGVILQPEIINTYQT